jgi:hypothetical protein
MSIHPTAFVSYSWDNDAHKEWVKQLAARLRSDAVRFIATHYRPTHVVAMGSEKLFTLQQIMFPDPRTERVFAFPPAIDGPKCLLFGGLRVFL